MKMKFISQLKGKSLSHVPVINLSLFNSYNGNIIIFAPHFDINVQTDMTSELISQRKIKEYKYSKESTSNIQSDSYFPVLKL